ncbi:hypothetical protein V2G26_000145 [Clonostachys chloroleuca]
MASERQSNINLSGSLTPDDNDVKEMSRLILDIVFEYALNKFDDSKDRLECGADLFISVIAQYVAEDKQIEACLPAFPFKSANKVHKVLGTMPDKAEELALERLNSMCTRIQAVYPPGCQVTIVSDGITYNDLLSISDQETWQYGDALQKMAIKKKFHSIKFSHMRDLIDIDLPEKLREITYVANCTTFRRLLINKYGRTDLDIDDEIANNTDTKLTYLGYKRFLESDLKYIFPRGAERTANGYRRDCKYLAKQMIIRGYAFAGAVKDAYPNHLRLSIHESIGLNKVSVCLLNTRTGFTTPWHCSVAQLANGEWISAPMGEFSRDNRLEVVYEDGKPSYFKEKPQDGLGIAESTASYLQVARPISASGYISGASTPGTRSRSASRAGSPSRNSSGASRGVSPAPPSPGLLARSLAALGGGSSRATTPEPPLLTLNNPEIVIEGDINSPSYVKKMPTPEPYGKRLIPQIMDSLAASDPERVVFSLATVSGNSLGLRHISAREFTKAVDKTAWWLQEHAGNTQFVQPVGYIGPHDLRHILLTYACVKVGYAALYLSPKNNTEGALAVLEATECNIWVNAIDATPVPLVREFLEQRSMKVLQLPLLNDLLDADSTDPFPYEKTFAEAKNDPFCYLHTSGSTGVPKPIPWSHGLIGTMDAIRLLPPVDGDGGLEPWTKDWKAGDKIYSSFPMSHGAGIIMDILMPALFQLQCVLGPANVLPNLNLIENLAENAQIDIWSMVPSLVDELGETPEVLTKFKPSKFICASGGPVSPVSAGKVNDIIRVLNLTGTTEGLFIGNLVTKREDWFWFCFHPYSGFEFKQLEDDTYEHWVHRNEHWPLFQGIFHTFPDKHSINFKDLYMRHPTKPNLWAFKGRSDDLVVLSNGYKISPLETEAFVTTHPAINGCLIFGTGKPQAGLLIELKDPSTKTDELINSIWETVKKANSLSRHKNQLLKDFVTFSEADKPFIRTDKRTVKRAATLALYADYIERFYSSRTDELDTSFTVDLKSEDSVQACIRQIFSSSIPEVKESAADTDLFALGLDSLGVFAAVKTIRAAIGLSAMIVRTAADSRAQGGPSLQNKHVDDEVTRLKQMIAQHKARQSFRLNAFDYVNPNHGMGLVFYFPLRDGVSNEQVFSNLQEGLNRTFDMIPALGGKMMNASEQEIGYVKGDLCVTIPPLSMASSAHNRLVYKDLSKVLPSFEKLRDAGFAPSAFKDSLVLRDDPFPKMPADIFVGQVNFVEGGCILAVDLNHCCMDGLGVMIALKAWAENCRYLQGDSSATCEWFDPESFNHSLPEILHEQEGWAKPLSEIDPGTWNYLPFHPLRRRISPAERRLNTTLFLIKPEKLAQMKQDVMVDPEAKGVISSISDIVQAFFWRAAIRARYRIATEIRNQTFSSDDVSILELPTDTRPFFSSLLPSTYMGSTLLLNRSSMPVETICSPKTSIGQVAYLLRQSAARITPQVVHDAFTILQSLPDHTRFSTANMGTEHMHAMISNMMLFPTSEINFGEQIFANAGSPESMRPQLDRGSGRFRFLLIFPMKKDGGVELVLGTHPEELEMFKADEEFTKYAELVEAL